MKENGRLERGDFIKLRSLESEGEWATGMVALASDTDPQSVVVMIGDGDPLGHAPLTINYASETVENLITGERYEVLVNSKERDYDDG